MSTMLCWPFFNLPWFLSKQVPAPHVPAPHDVQIAAGGNAWEAWLSDPIERHIPNATVTPFAWRPGLLSSTIRYLSLVSKDKHGVGSGLKWAGVGTGGEKADSCRAKWPLALMLRDLVKAGLKTGAKATSNSEGV